MGVDPSLPVVRIAGGPMQMAFETTGRPSRLSISAGPTAVTFPPCLR